MIKSENETAYRKSDAAVYCEERRPSGNADVADE